MAAFRRVPRAFFNGYEAEWPLAPALPNAHSSTTVSPCSTTPTLGCYCNRRKPRRLELNELIAARGRHLRRLTWKGEGEGGRPGSHRLARSTGDQPRYPDAAV